MSNPDNKELEEFRGAYVGWQNFPRQILRPALVLLNSGVRGIQQNVGLNEKNW